MLPYVGTIDHKTEWEQHDPVTSALPWIYDQSALHFHPARSLMFLIKCNEILTWETQNIIIVKIHDVLIA